jgi:GNAT superfamily N-acetyltransferase
MESFIGAAERRCCVDDALISGGGDCVVRTATRSDLLSVLRVHAQTGPGVVLPGTVSELEQETWARMMDAENLTVYLAEVGGLPVGTASVLIMPNLTYQCAPTAFIEAVVVAHPWRRRGIATAILRRALSDTATAGCNKVQLLSHKRHAADGAHALYRQLGFEPEADGFRLYHGAVPDAVLSYTARSPNRG